MNYCINLVHRYPELCSPLSEGEGKNRVQGHCGNGDGGVCGAAGEGQDPRDEGQLQDGRHHIEHQGGEHEADGARTTV